MHSMYLTKPLTHQSHPLKFFDNNLEAGLPGYGLSTGLLYSPIPTHAIDAEADKMTTSSRSRPKSILLPEWLPLARTAPLADLSP
jgi:hypothetical protein